MAIKKVAAKATKTTPSVTVETKKILTTEACCSQKPCCKIKPKKLIVLAFTLLNTVLLAILLINQTKMETMRAGGRDNYKLLQQVLSSDGYQAQQKQQLEQALQVLSQPQQTAQTAPVDAAATTPVDTQAAQTTPAVARPTQR